MRVEIAADESPSGEERHSHRLEISRRDRRHGYFNWLILAAGPRDVVPPRPAERVELGGADGGDPREIVKPIEHLEQCRSLFVRRGTLDRFHMTLSNTSDMANPGFTLESLTKDRTSRPPTKRTIRLNATCMAMNGRIAPERADTRPPLAFRAVIGSIPRRASPRQVRATRCSAQ